MSSSCFDLGPHHVGEAEHQAVVARSVTKQCKSLESFIVNQFTRLSEAEQHILQVASCVGIQCEESMLMHMLPSRYVARLAKAMRNLSAADLLRKNEDFATFSFAHALVQRAVYRLSPGHLRRLYHRKIGLYFEKLHASDLRPYYGTMSYHFIRSTVDRTKVVKYSRRAAEQVAEERDKRERQQRSVLDSLMA